MVLPLTTYTLYKNMYARKLYKLARLLPQTQKSVCGNKEQRFMECLTRDPISCFALLFQPTSIYFIKLTHYFVA